MNLSYSQLIERYPQLSVCQNEIITSIEVMHQAFLKGNKVIAFGNGGSSADAEHFCGELQKSFIKDRPLSDKEREQLNSVDPILAQKLEGGLPALSLSVMHSSHSAISNDIEHNFAFAQQLWALSKVGDIAIGFSTSGKSQNVLWALKAAKAKKLKTIFFTGKAISPCSEVADITIHPPEELTHKVQELHLPIYHAICMEIENLIY